MTQRSPVRPTVHLEVAVLDDVEVTVDGYVLLAGRMVGWVRRHPAGWSAVVAGAAAYVPPCATVTDAVDRLLRHPERGGPLLLEHLSPATASHLITQLGTVEQTPARAAAPAAAPRCSHGAGAGR